MTKVMVYCIECIFFDTRTIPEIACDCPDLSTKVHVKCSPITPAYVRDQPYSNPYKNNEKNNCKFFQPRG